MRDGRCIHFFFRRQYTISDSRHASRLFSGATLERAIKSNLVSSPPHLTSPTCCPTCMWQTCRVNGPLKSSSSSHLANQHRNRACLPRFRTAALLVCFFYCRVCTVSRSPPWKFPRCLITDGPVPDNLGCDSGPHSMFPCFHHLLHCTATHLQNFKRLQGLDGKWR